MNGYTKFNPASLADVRNFWLSQGRHPSRRLGQNFLVDANIPHIITDAAGITAADTVLEIGPGLGILTGILLERAGHVFAVEKDRLLHAHLARVFGDNEKLELINADALMVDYADLMRGADFKLVANLPYSCGTAMLVDFFHGTVQPACMVVTLQLEVGQRLAAAPGDADYGLLGLWAGLDYQAEIYKKISSTCFWPAPLVQSAVVRLRRRPHPAATMADRGFFFELTKQAFGRRRKQMATVLRGLPLLKGCNPTRIIRVFAETDIDPHARPESLNIEQWGRLADNLISTKVCQQSDDV